MSRSFGITFDYLCPFARNASEHVVTGLRAGAAWDVTFVAYSLAQGHVDEGQPDVWDRDGDAAPGVLALQVGITVRDRFPARFLDVHEAIFAARHDEGADIKDEAVLRGVLTAAGIDADEVFDAVKDGTALKLLREEHDAGVRDHGVWGVPTFITDARSVFVRLMDRPADDAVVAQQRIEQVVDLVNVPLELHEFKQVDLAI